MGLLEFILTYWDWYLYAAGIVWIAALTKTPDHPRIIVTLLVALFIWPVLLLLLFIDD